MCISEAENFISVMISAGSLLVAIGSFIVAAISLHKASKAQDLQNRVNELELQVKEHDLEAISRELAAKISCWIGGEVPAKDDNTITKPAKYETVISTLFYSSKELRDDIIEDISDATKKNFEILSRMVRKALRD